MAASVPISGLTPLATALASNDLFVFVDVSDTTQSAQGSTKKIMVADAYTAITVNTSLTVTGTASITGNTTIGGTLGVTGLITANAAIHTTSQEVIQGTFAGVAHSYIQVINAGSNLLLGVESNIGGALFTGTAANAVVFGTASANSLQLATNNTVRLTIDSAGLVTIPGTINGQTISATAALTGTLNVAGDFSIATNKLTVAASSGNTVVAGTLGVTGNSTLTGTLTVNNAVQLGNPAGANLITIGGNSYGAGVASLRLNGLTNGPSNTTGTLGGCPRNDGGTNPQTWFPISIAGVIHYIPAWQV